MRYFCIFLFLCAYTLLISEECPTILKAFIVYEAENSPLKKCYQADRLRMKKSLQTIASLTKLTPEIKTVMTSQLHPSKLFAWIHKLSPKDVAVFYYVGKRSYDLANCPSLSFPGIRCVLSQAELTNAMKEQSPHLSVILFDSYNSVLSSRWKHAIKEPSAKAFPKIGMARLFLKSSGVVSACSLTRKEPGYAIRHKRLMGGIFSLGIQNYLHSFDPKTMAWYDLLNYVKSTCRRVSGEKQYPQVFEEIKNPSMHHSHIKSKTLNKH